MYYEIPETQVRVLGSMHVVPLDAEPVPDWARAAYDWCEDLVIESDPPSLMQVSKMEHPRLQALIPPRAWQALQGIWPPAGPISPLASVKPWAAFLIFGALTLQRYVVPGIEPALLQRAAEDGRPVGYLETAAGLGALFDTAPLDEICQAFDVALDNLPQAPTQLIAMHSAWRTRDREAFYAVASSLPLFAFPGIRKVILEQRNRSWLAAMERLIASPRRTLVVVGALHLCGPGNLEECLGKKFEQISA